MPVNRIRSVVIAAVLSGQPVTADELTIQAQAGDSQTTIKPYEVPTFTGEPVDWRTMKPAIQAKRSIDADRLFNAVLNCYPLKPWGIEIAVRAGAHFNPTDTGTLSTVDSQRYYAGIVASMPLYSSSEIDKQREREYKRRLKTSETIAQLMQSTAMRRRAERVMGLYLSLEKRAQVRIANGITGVEEQIRYLDKVAHAQAELDMAHAQIQGARIALVGQCRPEVAEQVNNLINREIKP